MSLDDDDIDGNSISSNSSEINDNPENEVACKVDTVKACLEVHVIRWGGVRTFLVVSPSCLVFSGMKSEHNLK